MKRLTVAVILGLALAAAMSSFNTAYAHHFKGLPHFNYFENYPQVPQDEYLWQEGEHEFSLVIYDFQGIQRADAEQPDDARLYLVIWSLRESKIYSGPLNLKLMDHGRVIHSVGIPAATEENIYSLHYTLPETGKYSLVVEAVTRGGPSAHIPFKLSSQKTRWGRWVTISLVVLVLIVAAGSRRARVLQDRRDSLKARKRTRADGKAPVHGN